MRRTTTSLAALAGAALLLAGCGSQSGSGTGSGTGGKGATVAPSTAPSGSGCASTVELKAINAGLAVRPGDATAAYRAQAVGTAKLTSSRPLCAEPSAPGAVSCKGIQEWTVTVTVK